MISILANIFIKNKNEYKNEKVRRMYGVLCGIVGIFLNIVLFGIKFLAGTISGSIAITADAMNNLSDAGSSIITLVGFKMAGQKPDPDHPFGHGRIEYISGLLVSVVIILMAWELLKSSIDKIIHPAEIESSPVILLILVVSILIKIYMSFYNRGIGKKIDSAALLATSKDSLSDTVATTVVLISTLVCYFTGYKIDGYSGVLVSIFVFFAGFSAIKDTIGPLLGQPPEKEFVESIENLVMSDEHKAMGLLGVHDLVVHDYGPGRVMITLHAEVPSTGDVMELHDLIDNIEYDLATELNCHATIHMDPVCVGDPVTDELKAYVSEAIAKLNEEHKEAEVTFHDFRLVKGPTHTNVIFDVVLPFKYSMEETEVSEFIQKYMKSKKKRVFVKINFDRAYT